MIRETIKEVRKNLFKKAYKEELNEPDSSLKAKQRYKIEKQVFDTQDSVADNAKMISLMITLLSRFYDSFTDTQKNRIPQEDKALIEYLFSKFAETNTRADVQFSQEGGQTMVDKLLDRQAKIGEIVK